MFTYACFYSDHYEGNCLFTVDWKIVGVNLLRMEMFSLATQKLLIISIVRSEGQS